jgi:hypothetical protein
MYIFTFFESAVKLFCTFGQFLSAHTALPPTSWRFLRNDADGIASLGKDCCP